MLLPRSTHPEFHLIFDAIRGSDFIDDGKSFRLTLASHPGKALVVTDAAKPKGGEFVILGDASDALEVSTVRGSNHRSEGVYVATTANPGDVTGVFALGLWCHTTEHTIDVRATTRHQQIWCSTSHTRTSTRLHL